MLWQVIAERSPDHVVNGLRINRKCSRHVVVARPGALGEVRVLHAPLNAAFRSVIEPVPKADSALDNVASVSCAGSTGAGSVLVGRIHFRAATGVVGEWRAITSDSTGRSGHRGGGGNRGTKLRPGEGVCRQLYRGIAFVGCAGAILITYVSVQIKF